MHASFWYWSYLSRATFSTCPLENYVQEYGGFTLPCLHFILCPCNSPKHEGKLTFWEKTQHLFPTSCQTTYHLSSLKHNIHPNMIRLCYRCSLEAILWITLGVHKTFLNISSNKLKSWTRKSLFLSFQSAFQLQANSKWAGKLSLHGMWNRQKPFSSDVLEPQLRPGGTLFCFFPCKIQQFLCFPKGMGGGGVR